MRLVPCAWRIAPVFCLVVITGIFPRALRADENSSDQTQQSIELDVDDLVQRKLADKDDWESEVLYERAKKQLKELSAQLTDPTRRQNLDLTGLFTANSRVSDLRPIADVEPNVFNGYSIRRGTDASGSSIRQPASNSLQSLMAPYDQIGGQRIEFKALRINKHDEKSFSTAMLFQCFGPSASGFLQQNAVWNIDWETESDPQHPLITSIDVDDFIEISTADLQYVDDTAAILASEEATRSQLEKGAEYWHGRVDTLGGISFWGHQGIAIGDVNGDDLEDVYLAQSTGKPNLLLIQNPNGTTSERAAEYGVNFLDNTKGVLLIDVDNDGDQDLCCAIGASLLISRNNGNGKFVPAATLRAPDPADFYSLCAADHDLDGDLDIYATRYVAGQYGVSIPIPWHDANNGPTNHLFRNDGAFKFHDVTREVRLDVNNRRFSLAASWADYDNDGDLDLYVANDFGRNNLYRNDGDQFTDVAAESGTEDQSAGMGVSWADYDLDGNVDLHVSNMFSSAGNRIAYQRRFRPDQSQDSLAEFQRHARGNSLYHNQGDGTFVDVSQESRITMGRWSWGSHFVDLNNDSYPDIVTPNGFLTNHEQDDL